MCSGATALDARNPLATLIGLLRAAKPTHAYEVRGVLMERAQIPRYGVAVRVLRLPSDGTPPAHCVGRDVGDRAAQGRRRGDRDDPPADARCAARRGARGAAT